MPLFGNEIKPSVAARDHLLAGCISFMVFVFLAWMCALLDNHFRKATLSEMVRDWDTAQGKIFIPAVLLPAVFFLLSGYPYVLPNARVENHRLGRAFLVVRHFFVNAGLILVAFVPTLDDASSGAHEVEIFVHGFAAALAFVSFAVSELFILVCHGKLHEGELLARSRSLSFMIACLILCFVHKMLATFQYHPEYSGAWTFRYEMLVGSGLITQNQLIWWFSGPNADEPSAFSFYLFTMFPHLGALGMLSSDIFSRHLTDATHWMIGEAVLAICMWWLCNVLISCAQRCPSTHVSSLEPKLQQEEFPGRHASRSGGMRYGAVGGNPEEFSGRSANHAPGVRYGALGGSDGRGGTTTSPRSP
eukprot:TRINITY_DN55028_c0_g1_i1.p1 TRINITY_DN55028_c0_g1~~TRINITY_DN55028_c0_g1_i1.p1  ORF type:complete len:361 (-),score=58.99 TRINITY_DN55028_c0_g1_i1:99-1181(-)